MSSVRALRRPTPWPSRPDCALVDINLGAGPDFALAKHLLERGVFVVLMTGYDSNALPETIADVPSLQKPVSEETIMAALAAACAR